MPQPRTEPCVSRVHLWHVGWAGARAPGSHCRCRSAQGGGWGPAAAPCCWDAAFRLGPPPSTHPMLPSGTQLYRPQQPHEETWATEDGGPMVAPQQAPLPEPPAPGHLLPEPGFPDADPTQVYSPNLPPAPVLPSSVPPYAPVSQPTPQFILQGSLPLSGCWVTQSPAPVPTVLTTASEPAGHAAATNNSEDRTATARPAAEKAKNEEVRPVPFPQGRHGQDGWALTHIPAPST